jgi:hypothetical protein
MNDAATIANLLRALASGTDAKELRHDIIFEAAALLIDVLPDGRSRLLQEHSLQRSQLANCNKEIVRLRAELLSRAAAVAN